MSDDSRVSNWLGKFLTFVHVENPELVELYANQIFLSKNDKGEPILAYEDLSELYATKEQIKKMRELFDDYYEANPI